MSVVEIVVGVEEVDWYVIEVFEKAASRVEDVDKVRWKVIDPTWTEGWAWVGLGACSYWKMRAAWKVSTPTAGAGQTSLGDRPPAPDRERN